MTFERTIADLVLLSSCSEYKSTLYDAD